VRYADGVIRPGLEIVRKYATNFQASVFVFLSLRLQAAGSRQHC
jgi:hypothetical protein